MQEDDLQPSPEPPRHRLAGAVLLIASLAAIGYLTLAPMPVTLPIPPVCIICGPLGGVDFALNIAMLLPVGVAILWLGRPIRDAFLVGLAVTIVIEALQWRAIPGRDASLGDIIANTIGSGLGAWLGAHAPRWVRASGRVARRLATVAALLAMSLVFLFAWLMAPAPPTTPQFVLWTAIRPDMYPFAGVLRTVTVNGRAAIGGDRVDPVSLRSGQPPAVRIEALVTARPHRTRRKTHVVAVANRQQEGAFLGQWRDQLIFRSFQNGSRLRLRPLLVRLDHAFPAQDEPPPPDRTATLTATSDRRSIRLTSTAAEPARTVAIPRTMALAWSLFLPWDVAVGPPWLVVNAIFLGVLVAPVTYLAQRGRRVPDESPARWPLVMVAGVVVAVGTAPALLGLAATTTLEWAGVAAGVVAGVLAARLTSARSA